MNLHWGRSGGALGVVGSFLVLLSVAYEVSKRWLGGCGAAPEAPLAQANRRLCDVGGCPGEMARQSDCLMFALCGRINPQRPYNSFAQDRPPASRNPLSVSLCPRCRGIYQIGAQIRLHATLK